MTPEEKAEFEELKVKIEELTKFMEEKKRQQISFPLDTASQNIISDI